MAGKTLIGGTAYTITGGKTMIGGTVRSLKSGKTLIGGTAYDVKLGGSPFFELMSNASLYAIAGRDASSTSTVLSSDSSATRAGTFYVFSFYNGYMSINKVVFIGAAQSTSSFSATVLAETSSSYGHIYVAERNTRTDVYYAHRNGSKQSNVYGATIAKFQFPGYTETEIDTILSSISLTRIAGRATSTMSTVSGACASNANIFAATNTYIGISMPIGTLVWGNRASNPSLIYYNGSNVGISVNPPSFLDTLYGGSLVSFTEN